MQINTVLGPIAPDRLGITLPHEHLQVDLFRVSRDRNGRLSRNDIPLIVEELGAFTAAGGATVVELSNLGLGRDPAALKQISVASGVQIVMGCGWYRQLYYDHEYIAEVSTRELADSIVHEIEHGESTAGVKPGIIGEIGADLDYVSPAEERVLRAAARAHLRTGLTISTHGIESPVGLQQLDILEDEGVDLRHVIVGHCSTWWDTDYHAAVAKRGAYVQFDTIRGIRPYDEEQAVRCAKALIDAGRLNQLLLSHDVCFQQHLKKFGGGGYGYVPTVFAAELKSAGASEEQVRILLVDNPRRALSGEA